MKELKDTISDISIKRIIDKVVKELSFSYTESSIIANRIDRLIDERVKIKIKPIFLRIRKEHRESLNIPQMEELIEKKLEDFLIEIDEYVKNDIKKMVNSSFIKFCMQKEFEKLKNDIQILVKEEIKCNKVHYG